MNWKAFFLRSMGIFYFCPPDEGGGAGNADPAKGDQGKGDGKGDGKATDPAALLAAANARIAELERKISSHGGGDDPDLARKAALQREKDEQEAAKSRRLETAMRFDMQSEEFLRKNEALLPKEVADIFKAAGRETYANAIEKDQAIKAGLIASFYGVQANYDSLTTAQKGRLDAYMKLTKTGKEQKSQEIYDDIFEPHFEQMKRMRKADALSSGRGYEDDGQARYKQRMIASSKKHYLGEKA